MEKKKKKTWREDGGSRGWRVTEWCVLCHVIKIKKD